MSDKKDFYSVSSFIPLGAFVISLSFAILPSEIFAEGKGVVDTQPKYRKGIQLEYRQEQKTSTQFGETRLTKTFFSDFLIKTTGLLKDKAANVRLTLKELHAQIERDQEKLKYNSKTPKAKGQSAKLGLLIEAVKGNIWNLHLDSLSQIKKIELKNSKIEASLKNFLQQFASPNHLKSSVAFIYSLAPGKSSVSFDEAWTTKEKIQISPQIQIEITWEFTHLKTANGQHTLKMKGKARFLHPKSKSTNPLPKITEQKLEGELVWDTIYQALRKKETRIQLVISVPTKRNQTQNIVLKQHLVTKLQGVP